MERPIKEAIVVLTTITIGGIGGWFMYHPKDRFVGALTGIAAGTILSSIVITIL